MTEKTFSIESAETKEPPKYKAQIISIVNDVEKKVRFIDPESDKTLFKAVHTEKNLDTRREAEECEQIRQDICESFGVNIDDEHVIIYDPHKGQFSPKVNQRAFRCFYVLIDSHSGEAYYAEGRTIHNALLNKIVHRMTQKNRDLTEDSIFEKIDTDPPQIMVFKGFLSADKFSQLESDHRALQEQHLYDEQGQKVETAPDWFLSGHNLPEKMNG